MNKQLFILFAASALMALTPHEIFAPNIKGKQLVQSQVDQLNKTLAETKLNYKNRKHILSYLRRYFISKQSNKALKLKKPLVGPEKDVAKIITDSYENIVRTKGSHDKAANHYAAQAAGLVALYKKPKEMKHGITPSRSSEGGLMNKIGGMIPGLGGSPKTTEGTTGIGGQLPTKKTGTHPATRGTTTKKAKSHKTPAQKLEKKKRKAIKKAQKKRTGTKKSSKTKQQKKSEKKAKKARKRKKNLE